MLSEQIEEIIKDVAELEQLQQQASRQRIKNILSAESNKLNTELGQLREKQALVQVPTASKQTSTAVKRYDIKLNNYAWDQSPKFVKFYITLEKVQTIPADNVVCNFTHNSLELRVVDLDNKNYNLIIKNLLKPINPDQSNWKIKSDMVVVNAAKVEQLNWEFVTETEKRASDSKKLPTGDAEKMDPSEGLMSLMKNMYDQGTDEMKRTIAKAWHESQTKGPAF